MCVEIRAYGVSRGAAGAERGAGMKARWWKRLWLRYLFYCKQHWIIAGVATLWALWLVMQIAIQLLPVLVELLFEFVVALIAAV